MMEGENAKLLAMEDNLQARVVGQAEAPLPREITAPREVAPSVIVIGGRVFELVPAASDGDRAVREETWDNEPVDGRARVELDIVGQRRHGHGPEAELHGYRPLA